MVATNTSHQQQHPSQNKCVGMLMFEALPGQQPRTTCVGVTSPLKGAYVDLVEHHGERQTPTADSVLCNLSCVGAAVYQHQADPHTGTIPPPACLGIEFQRYRQTMMQSADLAGRIPGHQLPQMPSAAASQDAELLQPEHGQLVPTSHIDTTSSGSGSSPAAAVQGPQYEGRPSLLLRLQELHAEVSERLEGQDPLWFGKAFASRAAMNWESMKNMASQIVASAKADLGFPSSSSDERE